MPTREAVAAFDEAQSLAAKLRELDRQEGELLASIEAVASQAEADQLFDAIHAVRGEWASVFNQHTAAMGRYADEARRTRGSQHASIAPPASPASQARPPIASQPDSSDGDELRPALRGRRILLVDPDDKVLQQCISILAAQGCQVDVARSAAQAIEAINSLPAPERYDAIVAAVRLPDMNGVELCVHLSAAIDPHRMILTQGFGYESAAWLAKASRHGVRRCILTPFLTDQLLDALEQVISAPRPAWIANATPFASLPVPPQVTPPTDLPTPRPLRNPTMHRRLARIKARRAARAKAQSPLTAEQYAKRPEPDAKGRHELVRGEFVRIGWQSYHHGDIAGMTLRIVRSYVDEHDLGRVISGKVGLVTQRDPDTVRRWTGAFYSYAAVPKSEQFATYESRPPELVFEVKSLSSSPWASMYERIAEYLAVGVRAVCVVDATSESIAVHHSEWPLRWFSDVSSLTLPDVLGEGFRVPVSTFFR